MARRAGGGAVGSTQAVSNLQHGDVPPSTIAAKIVDNRANAQARQEPQSKELFSKLLQEYLADPAIEESSLETNAELVLVVAEAGLDPAQKEDPFSHLVRVQQASASLSVIRLTIERVPQVLFCCAGSSATLSNLPLFLILLPKILALVGKGHLDAIQEDLCKLVETCLIASKSNTVLWPSAEGLTRAVEVCIDGQFLLSVPIRHY